MLDIHLEALLVEWKKKEDEFTALANELHELRLQNNDMEMELEFANKKINELIMKNTDLMLELDDHINEKKHPSKKWYNLLF